MLPCAFLERCIFLRVLHSSIPSSASECQLRVIITAITRPSAVSTQAQAGDLADCRDAGEIRHTDQFATIAFAAPPNNQSMPSLFIKMLDVESIILAVDDIEYQHVLLSRPKAERYSTHQERSTHRRHIVIYKRCMADNPRISHLANRGTRPSSHIRN
jgi:hypothetical protein